MIFNNKLKFIIYTTEENVKKSPFIVKNKTYYFNDNGILELQLKKGVYTFYTMQKEIVFSLIDNNRVYLLRKEDNDCHYNLIMEDISQEEFNKLIHK